MPQYTYRCLMAVTLVLLKGREIGELKRPDHVGLPTWCLNKEYGNLVYSDYYLQFIEDGEEEYTLFNMNYASHALDVEINDAGMDSLFGDLDMRPLIGRLRYNTFENMGRRIPRDEFIVVDCTYTYSTMEPFDDYDSDFNVVGYLNPMMEFSPMTLQQIKKEK